MGCAPCLWIVLCTRPFARIYDILQKQTGPIKIEDRKNRCTTKGLRDRNSPTCTLSQNGYGARADSTALLPVHRNMFRLLLLLCLLLGGCCGCGWLACCDASRVVIIAHRRVAGVACVAAGAACWVAWGCTTSSSPRDVCWGSMGGLLVLGLWLRLLLLRLLLLLLVLVLLLWLLRLLCLLLWSCLLLWLTFLL